MVNPRVTQRTANATRDARVRLERLETRDNTLYRLKRSGALIFRSGALIINNKKISYKDINSDEIYFEDKDLIRKHVLLVQLEF